MMYLIHKMGKGKSLVLQATTSMLKVITISAIPLLGLGSGQEDKIPAWLSDGEYVWSAQDVADLGDGSTDEGVRRLDKMRHMVRRRAGRKDVKKIAKPQKGIDHMLKAVGGSK